MSVNWYWPVETSGTLPRTVQLLSAVVIFDDMTAVNDVPVEYVKRSWKLPFASRVPCTRIAAESSRMMAELLGMPFTYTVASTWPTGRPLIAVEVNVLEVHEVGVRKIIWSFCRLRS